MEIVTGWSIYIFLFIMFILLLTSTIVIFQIYYYVKSPYFVNKNTSTSSPLQNHETLSNNDNSSNITQENSVDTEQYTSKGYMREQIVCDALETIYKKGFPTKRPNFLINPETGERLEYDCYNEELKIAAEHNGQHHYEYPNAFHKSEEEFLYQRRRDTYKQQLSDEHGVYLITVPFWVPKDKIVSWIKYHLPETVKERYEIEKIIQSYKEHTSKL